MTDMAKIINAFTEAKANNKSAEATSIEMNESGKDTLPGML